MEKQNDTVTWSMIFRIVAIVTAVSGVVYGYANLESKIDYIANSMEMIVPDVAENKTDIALMKQFIGLKN